MDHILNQAPISRTPTPSDFALPSPRMSSGASANLVDRRPSTVSNIINPLTGQPGATPRSRRSSMSSSTPSPIQLEHHTAHSKESKMDQDELIPSSGVPWPRTWPRTATPGLVIMSSSPEPNAGGRLHGDLLPASPLVSTSSSRSTSQTSPAEGPRRLKTAEQLASRLPAHLQALRTSSNGSASPIESSPSTSLDTNTSPYPGSNADAIKRTSLLGITSSDVQGREPSNGEDVEHLAISATAGLAILVNSKCSGYFVEPVSRSSTSCLPLHY